MNNIKVSIIVPVYNAEKYLERCLNSLSNQTLEDIEIICINDGSIDDSMKILDRYAKHDNRIKIINQSNRGLSGARNVGIDSAKGEYLTFVDSDDWIQLSMLEDMYKYAINEKSDIVMCSYSREYSNKSRIKKFNVDDVIIYDEKEVSLKLHRMIIGPIDKELSKPDYTDALVTAWGKLYRKNVIKDNNIKFIDTSIIGTEDCLFNVYAFKYIKKAVFINKPYYYYWKENVNSLTSVHKHNLNERWMCMYQYIEDFLDKNSYEEVFYKALKNRICISLLDLGLNECNSANKISELKKIKNLNVLLHDKKIVESFRVFDFSNIPFHWKIFYISAKYKMTLIYYILLNIIEFLRTRV